MRATWTSANLIAAVIVALMSVALVAGMDVALYRVYPSAAASPACTRHEPYP